MEQRKAGSSSQYPPAASAPWSRHSCSVCTHKSHGNTAFLASFRLLETWKGKIFKSKQKAECVEANTATFEKQQSKADLSERSHCLSEYS